LISAGVKLKEVAERCGWSERTLYALYEGDTRRGNQTAALFHAEVRKIDREIVKKIDSLTRSNKKLAQELIERILQQLHEKPKLTPEEKKLVATLHNSLAKATPNVNIGSLTYNYTKGLNAEELIHEYVRLTTIASGTSNRGAVSELEPGRSGILHSPSERGSELAEEPEGS
jgi:AcrR family transcriptional regulator